MQTLFNFIFYLTLYTAVGVGYARYLNLTRWTDDDGIYKAGLAGLIWPYVMPAMLAVWLAETLASYKNPRDNPQQG